MLIIDQHKKYLPFFHNINGYDSHHIMQEIGKFDQKIKILNGIEKDDFYVRKELSFIDSTQVMDSSLENLVITN